MPKYYIAYKNERFGEPLSKEEALKQLFELRQASKTYEYFYDENDRLCGRIPKK